MIDQDSNSTRLEIFGFCITCLTRPPFVFRSITHSYSRNVLPRIPQLLFFVDVHRSTKPISLFSLNISTLQLLHEERYDTKLYPTRCRTDWSFPPTLSVVFACRSPKDNRGGRLDPERCSHRQASAPGTFVFFFASLGFMVAHRVITMMSAGKAQCAIQAK
jgi:hypothetical protein